MENQDLRLCGIQSIHFPGDCLLITALMQAPEGKVSFVVSSKPEDVQRNVQASDVLQIEQAGLMSPRISNKAY